MEAKKCPAFAGLPQEGWAFLLEGNRPKAAFLSGFIASAKAFVTGFSRVAAVPGLHLDLIQIAAATALVIGAAGNPATDGLAAGFLLGHGLTSFPVAEHPWPVGRILR